MPETWLEHLRECLPKSSPRLTCCSSDSPLPPQVPTKKLKKYEKEYQTMRESQLQQEDPMDRYKVWETQHLPEQGLHDP